MVEGLNNTQAINNQKAVTHVGELIPPDSHYKPVLYSSIEADKNFKTLNRDVYQNLSKFQAKDRYKTPKSVFAILIGAILTVPAVFLTKKIIKMIKK